jgi:hypothetical protein
MVGLTFKMMFSRIPVECEMFTSAACPSTVKLFDRHRPSCGRRNDIMDPGRFKRNTPPTLRRGKPDRKLTSRQSDACGDTMPERRGGDFMTGNWRSSHKSLSPNAARPLAIKPKRFLCAVVNGKTSYIPVIVAA